MHRTRLIAAIWALACTSVCASSFDNEAGEYVLTALPSAEQEAKRMDRMELCDQQPAGIYLRKGQTILVTASAVPDGYELAALVGFRPMWGVKQDQQETTLDSGENEFTADQDGPLFFRLTASARGDSARAEVQLQVSGGMALPLYVDGSMDAQDWEDELAAHAKAPFVQLLGEHALITLPARVHARDPVSDPEETFAAINEVLALEDALAGFDGKTRRDRPTPLRMHYLVDFRASKADRESFYMYATDQFIGMLPDNTSDLTDPEKLRSQWGIWHETGHTHQQNSWTWDALTEINVNLFSLYVQESLGQPSRMRSSDDGAPSSLENARVYLDSEPASFLDEVADDEEFFTRLVMFYQLKEAYGWELFTHLHKHFRAHPLPEDASDQDKADAMISVLCDLAEVDLRPFFEAWGLRASADADERIDDRGYPLPDTDLSEFLE